MIKVENVSMKFRINNDNVQSLKEFAIAVAKRKLKYKDFWVFRDISFNVQKGEVVGIIGRNGAGKSTLLKIISGILSPTEGNVKLGGKIVPMLELGSGFDFELTGRENIFLNGSILGYSDEFLKEKYDEILEFSELGDFIETPIRNYSSGMMMRLAFSIATIVEPEILIVDEILAVGDEAFQRKSKRKMLELMGGGTTVLFVSHSIGQIREMCNRVVWLENGKIKMQGETKYVCDKYQEYLNPTKEEETKKKKSSDAGRNLSDVLFIYGDHEEAYDWRVTYQREQLVVGAVPTNEIYYQDLTLEIAKLYRVFIFVKCEDTQEMRFFIKILKDFNKTILFDFSFIDNSIDSQEKLLESIGTLCDGIIVSNKMLSERYQKKGYKVYCNPLSAEEELLKYATWAVYDREVLPFCDKDKLSDDELINYNRALAKQELWKKDGKRIGFFMSDLKSKEFDFIKDQIVKILKENSNVKLFVEDSKEYVPQGMKEIRGQISFCNMKEKSDILRNFSEVDIALISSENISEQLDEVTKKWIYASLVKTPCFIVSENGGILDSLEDGKNVLLCKEKRFLVGKLIDILTKTDKLKQIGEKAYEYVMERNSSAYTGDVFAQYIRKQMKKNIAFLVSDFSFGDVGQIACHHAALLKKSGYDVMMITTGDKRENICFEDTVLPVVSRDTVYSYCYFEVMVAFDWYSACWLQNYSNVSKRFYFVQGFETDYYSVGNIMRLQANQMYTPHVQMQFVTASIWCENWLKKKYNQDVLRVENGIDFNSLCFDRKKFQRERIRVLIVGNSQLESENLEEVFKISEKLDKQRYEICFHNYAGNVNTSYSFEKLYCCQKQQEIVDMYQESDILLYSSNKISGLISPLSMMATGGVVVIMRDNSNDKYLRNNDNCLMYEKGNVEEAVEEIEKVALDIKYREKLIKNGIETAKIYDWKHFDEVLLKTYGV